MNNIRQSQEKIFLLFTRYVLAFAFLSAVADRFGIWGAAGTANIAWGNFENFENYVAFLNPYLHLSLISILSWFVTIIEFVFAMFLILGFFTRKVALLSGLLLVLFALSMIFASSIKVVFDYSVLSAASAAFLLYFLSSEDEV